MPRDLTSAPDACALRGRRAAQPARKRTAASADQSDALAISTAAARAEPKEDDIAGSTASDRPAVVAAWQSAFRTPVPPYLSIGFMKRALAYDEQCRCRGGLTAAQRRTLAALARGNGCVASAQTVARAGAQFVREWNGRTWRVEVLADGGYQMDGKIYRSLTAIAKRITGTNWSGPRFFGLVDRKGG